MKSVRRVLAVLVWISCLGYAIDWVIEIFRTVTGQTEGLLSFNVAIRGTLMIATFMLGAWLWGALPNRPTGGQK